MATKGVYCLTFPNGKRYFGVGLGRKGVGARWAMYRGRHCHSQPKLHNALCKYPIESVLFDVVVQTDDKVFAASEEQRLIALWQTVEHGYNISTGGEHSRLGAKLSDETKRKIAWAHLGKKRGPMAAETKAKIGAKSLGHVTSPETCAKLSLANKGRRGYRHTDAARAKMSANRKGKPVSPETRAKLSAANIGKPGHRQSAETLAKISAAHRGKFVSQETRAKISAAHRGKVISPEARAKMSESHKRRCAPRLAQSTTSIGS